MSETVGKGIEGPKIGSGSEKWGHLQTKDIPGRRPGDRDSVFKTEILKKLQDLPPVSDKQKERWCIFCCCSSAIGWRQDFSMCTRNGMVKVRSISMRNEQQRLALR